MALSNEFGWMVLTTGNKSEMAVGYFTIYGDSVGGYAVIKDVLKTEVYELCRYVNERAGREIIPEGVITKPPSAELRPDQRDDQSLPPYEVLDPILEAVRRGGPHRRRDRRARPRRGDRAAGHPPRRHRRVQAPPVPAGRARDDEGVRPRPAPADHQRLPRLIDVEWLADDEPEVIALPIDRDGSVEVDGLGRERFVGVVAAAEPEELLALLTLLRDHLAEVIFTVDPDRPWRWEQEAPTVVLERGWLGQDFVFEVPGLVPAVRYAQTRCGGSAIAGRARACSSSPARPASTPCAPISAERRLGDQRLEEVEAVVERRLGEGVGRRRGRGDRVARVGEHGVDGDPDVADGAVGRGRARSRRRRRPRAGRSSAGRPRSAASRAGRRG